MTAREAVKLTKLDRELLESIAGKRTHHADGSEIRWGAWMSVCLEFLEGNGLLAVEPSRRGLTYVITPAGRAALREGEG